MVHRAAPATVALAILAGPALALDYPEGTDPVFSEATEACLVANETGGFLPKALGWDGPDAGDPNVAAWETWNVGTASKTIDGVGRLALSALVERYPGYQIGVCTITINEPLREIDAPPLKRAPGFTGTLQGDPATWWGLWRTDDSTVFIRGYYNEAEIFELSVKTIAVMP